MMNFLEKTLKIVIEFVKVKHSDLVKRPDAALRCLFNRPDMLLNHDISGLLNYG